MASDELKLGFETRLQRTFSSPTLITGSWTPPPHRSVVVGFIPVAHPCEVVKDNAKLLESHGAILCLFATILKNGKWSDDKVDDQQPPNSYDPDQDVGSAGAVQEHADDEVRLHPPAGRWSSA